MFRGKLDDSILAHECPPSARVPLPCKGEEART
jgi:hypothetical protein